MVITSIIGNYYGHITSLSLLRFSMLHHQRVTMDSTIDEKVTLSEVEDPHLKTQMLLVSRGDPKPLSVAEGVFNHPSCRGFSK